MLNVPIRLTLMTLSKSASGMKKPSRKADHALGNADAGAIDQHPRGAMGL